MESSEWSALYVEKLRTLLLGVAPQVPIVRPLGPRNAGAQLAVFLDCPRRGLTTLVTVGFSAVPFSSWRGLPLGIELTLTTESDPSPFMDLLGSLAGGQSDPTGKDRRRIVEFNGVWAPGYPPHLVFTSVVSATPQLIVQKKVGDRYVQWLTAVAIDDAELRRYDRNIPEFLDDLTPESIITYPRITPVAF